MAKLKNWTITQQDDCCLLTLDVPGKTQNVLSSLVLNELDQVLDEIETLDVKGLIIQSAKSTSFISGADISEFQKIESCEQALEITGFANAVLHRIEGLAIPSVAMINGHCLGGGLELALACKYRVSIDDPTVRLGLPEVKLGIHPGFGGSIRLIETIGVPAGMDLILSGRTVVPYVAKKSGLVDQCVPLRQLERTAKYIIEKQPKPRRAGKLLQAINLRFIRPLMAMYLRKQVNSKAIEDHYPAPFAVIDLWETHGGNRNAMFEAEQRSVSNLVVSKTSKNLVKVYFLQEELKKLGSGSRGKNIKNFQHIHVIGAGVMGGDIAAWCALRGLSVTIHDRSAEALARATRRANQLFQKKLKVSRSVERAMDRFQQDLSGSGARTADVIIEAIFENAEAKIGVFTDLEKVAKPDAILATNTSSIPLEVISEKLKKPSRLVGLHFFNPVAKMQLIEIVAGEKTQQKIVKSAAAFATQISRLPIAVKSSPGFLVNRVLMPYTLEAVELLGQGIPADVIDDVAMKFGMPMGPITLADTVGLDICYHVGENLTRSFGGELPPILKQKVDAEHLGKKSGKGFYTWEKGKPVKTKISESYDNQSIEDRLLFRYINECIACLHEQVVNSPEHLDGALIFGTGFAPFTGGPINYILDQQPSAMLQKLEQLHEQFGERFKPSDGWTDFVQSSEQTV